jgi:ribose transport system substrate-binding protein
MHARPALSSAFWIVLALSGAPLHAQEIAAVLAGSRGSYWMTVEKGITQAGAELGVSIAIRSPVDDDPRTVAENLQFKMVQSMLEAGARSLILAPIPVHDLATPIRYDVPVILIDRPSTQFTALSTVSTDNYGSGRAAAQTLKGQLPEGARVGVVRLAPDVVSTTARENGFVDGVRAMGFELVVDAYAGHGIREPEMAATTALGPYRGRLDALFTPNGNVTLGVLRALQSWPPAERPRLIGFDYRPGFELSLRDGNLYALVMQDPFRMGYTAVQQLVAFRAGQKIPREVTIDVVVVTSANLHDPGIRAALERARD